MVKENFTEGLERANTLSAAGVLIEKHLKQPSKDTGTHHNKGLESNTKAQNVDFKPRKTENKSKRLQLLVKPSTVKRLDTLSKRSKTSRNELINQILENYLERI